MTGRKLSIDTDAGVVEVIDGDQVTRHDFDSPEAFDLISQVWLRVGWDTKYVYGFSWLGRPIIQLPSDLLRVQEVIYEVAPDVIIETGVAHGGSLVYYASLCAALGRGRVVGIDIEIRKPNREAIEAHLLAGHITLIEGSSTAPEVVEEVRTHVRPGERVIVLLDSNHTKAHVLDELRAYASMVSVDSYIVAADGIMADVVGAPRTSPDWSWDNPREAVREFLAEDDRFVLTTPTPPFNEGTVKEAPTYWGGGWLRRVR